MKLVGSTDKAENVGPLLNKIFYSTSYQYDGKQVTWFKGVKDDIVVKFKRNRYLIYQLNKI